VLHNIGTIVNVFDIMRYFHRRLNPTPPALEASTLSLGYRRVKLRCKSHTYMQFLIEQRVRLNTTWMNALRSETIKVQISTCLCVVLELASPDGCANH